MIAFNYKIHKRKNASLRVTALLTYMILNSFNFFGQENSNFIKLFPSLNNKTISVNSTLEDHLGYILMEYPSGIAKYDGHSYSNTGINEIFQHLDNDRIVEINRDYRNNIWITTQNGLVAVRDTLGCYKQFNSIKEKAIQLVYSNKNTVILGSKNGGIYKYNYAGDSLEKITSIPNIVPNISEIHDIALTESNELFVSTDHGKVYQYSIEENKLTLLNGPFSDYPGYINLTLDLNERLWIGTETFGLFAYDLSKKQFVQDTIFKSPLYNIKKEMFISLFCDSKGFIWAGTDGGGLYHIDPNNGTIQLYTHQNINNFSISTNTLTDISEDSHENIWVVSNYGGVNVFPSGNSKIQYHEGSDKNIPARVLSIYKSSKGVLWAGTDGEGITKIITKKEGTISEKQYFTNKHTKKGFYIQSIVEDNKSNIWFGTYKNGLWHYNFKKDTFKNISIKNSSFQEATDVRTLYKDSKERIWVGSNLALSVYSSNLILLATFENKKQELKGSIAESIIEDNNGSIWIGYFKGGLFKLKENPLDFENSVFKNYTYYDEKTYSNDILGIKFMTLDSSGFIWLINSHGNLSKYNPLNNSYQSYYDFEPLKNIDISAVLTEDKNNLWLSSSNGILNFNVEDSIINAYHEIDGLQDNFFLPRSAFKDEKGMLYFGGIKGLNIFKPENLTKQTNNAKLYINSLEILNQSASSLIPDQIPADVEYLKNIRLEPNQSSFSFRFSAIDNVLNSNYHYAYRLLGFNNEWIPAKREQLATYTNIPSGNYTFEVKAGSRKGVWDISSKKINIEITQPVWNKPIAYFLYILTLALLGFWAIKWYHLKGKFISEKISYSKNKELHALKMDFFAKMSHEIQTPLTLISGPIDNMLKRADENGNLLLNQRLQIISNNVKRLSRIVFELTTVRNKEFEKIRLFVTKNNLNEELNNISLSFKEQARFKNIDFTVNCPQNLSEVYCDIDKFEHIIYNLLSNAFKFTPKEGNIQVIAIPINNKNSIKISISDSGSGIPKEELENIFTLFYQCETGKQSKGTGIGLALTKELIDIHRGKIEVDSSPNEGTTFSITFPITKEAYLEEELVITDFLPIKTKNYEILNNPIETATNSKYEKSILIVEDNFELQHFLKDLLSPIYNIIIADNGEEGLYYAKKNHPVLILSDILMPKMDGIEMCKLLHSNHLTKHIPIILLTANNSTTSKIEGLESGAIEYINKPFNTNELILKINNIITSTEHIISKFKQEVLSSPEINIERTQDEIFLEKLVSVINSKLENPNFKMEELVDAFNMSYSALFRKCQALTNESLVDLVRQLRLKKAAIVIAKYGYNISDAAYVSGFNDPKYFSKCFKKHFGITPNTFKKESLQTGSEIYLNKYKLYDSLSEL